MSAHPHVMQRSNLSGATAPGAPANASLRPNPRGPLLVLDGLRAPTSWVERAIVGVALAYLSCEVVARVETAARDGQETGATSFCEQRPAISFVQASSLRSPPSIFLVRFSIALRQRQFAIASRGT